MEDKPKQEPKQAKAEEKPMEVEKGGFKEQGLLEPTRYGDWDVKGRCSDF